MNKLLVLQEKFIGRNWSRAPRTDSILKSSQKLSYKEYRSNEMPFRCTTQSIQRKLFTLFNSLHEIKFLSRKKVERKRNLD